MDDNGPWYVCDRCNLDWQAPGHLNPKACPECGRTGREAKRGELK